jgi:hypothetical protein
MFEQKGERVVDRLGRDEVIVVQNQHPARPWGSADLVDQCREHRLRRGWLRGVQRAQHTVAYALLDRLECRNHVGQKLEWVVVALVQ